MYQFCLVVSYDLELILQFVKWRIFSVLNTKADVDISANQVW